MFQIILSMIMSEAEMWIFYQTIPLLSYCLIIETILIFFLIYFIQGSTYKYLISS